MQSGSQSVSGQSKGRNGSAVAVVRPCPTPRRRRWRRRRRTTKKVDGFLGGRKKGWGPRAEFCLENGALGGLVLVVDMSTAKTESQKQIQRRWENHVRSKLPLLLVAMEMMECPPMFQNTLCRKISFTISPFRGDFFWESEKGMRNPIRPSVRSLRSGGSRDLTLLTSVLTAFDLTTLQTAAAPAEGRMLRPKSP